MVGFVGVASCVCTFCVCGSVVVVVVVVVVAAASFFFFP